MATNEILEFGENATGGDILSQAAYDADADRLIGNQVGVARQELVNKAMKQASVIAAAVGQFMADNQSNDIVDTDTPADIAGYLELAIRAFGIPTVAGGGTADAITATFVPAPTLTNGLLSVVRAVGANTVVAPTLNANGSGAVAIVKDNNTALRIGDIAGSAHWMVLVYSTTLSKWILVNPASNIQATETTIGQAEIATQTETNTGSDDLRIVTPLKLSNARKNILIVQDEKNSGTDGGTFNSGSWQTRTLNTEQYNGITGASLSSNQITLPAGTYRILATAPTVSVGDNKLKFRNITDSTDDLIGTSCNDRDNGGGGDNGGGVAVLEGILTIAGAKVFELQHRCTAGQSTTGFGAASGYSVVEVYAQVTIEKL